jgi:hypothetical protein
VIGGIICCAFLILLILIKKTRVKNSKISAAVVDESTSQKVKWADQHGGPDRLEQELAEIRRAAIILENGGKIVKYTSDEAAIKIQSNFRGYSVRSKNPIGKKLSSKRVRNFQEFS